MSGSDTLLLQAYGGPRHLRQARFCLLTFQHWALRAAEPPRVLVYTTRPEEFAGTGDNVETVPVSEEQLARWRGAIDFVHRIKLEVLLDALARRPGRLLYVDGDTWFPVDPAALFARIAPGRTLMRVSEGPFSNRSNGIQRKMHRFVTRHAFALPGGETVRIPGETEMWDAGVIGIHSDDRPLVARALALTDAMYPLYPKHVIEQSAVSYVLQTSTALGATGDDVEHYWRSAKELEPRIAEFLEAHRALPAQEQADRAAELRPRGGPPRPKRRWWERMLGLRR